MSGVGSAYKASNSYIVAPDFQARGTVVSAGLFAFAQHFTVKEELKP
jgi:hypothetical protein